MVSPVFQASDFLAAFQKLLPLGKVWPRDPDATLTAFLASLAPTYARQTESAAGLLSDSPAFNLNELLPDWEETLGLPDSCAPSSITTAQRVANVKAKFATPGGQSAAYFIALAASIGFPGVTITNYAPARAGRSHCGDPCGGEAWAFYWLVDAPTLSVFYAQCGISRCGDPLYSLGGTELECVINKYSPAHTTVGFTGTV